MQAAERRKNRRFLVAGAVVDCRLHGIISLLEKSAGNEEPVVNLSLGGIQFLAREPLKLNDKVDLTITIPDQPAPIKTRAAVKGVQQLEDGRWYRVDAAFVGLSAQQTAALQSLEQAVAPKQQEMLQELAERLADSPEEVETYREMLAQSVGLESAEETDSGESSDVLDGVEAVDKLLSDALSRQKERRQAEPEPEPEAPARKKKRKPDAEPDILRPLPLGDDSAAGEERRVSKLLEIFLSKEASLRAYELTDDSMTSARRPSFPAGSIVVFAKRRKARSGDFALVETSEGLVFRQVFFEGEAVRLRPLNPRYAETTVRRGAIKSISRLVGRYETL